MKMAKIFVLCSVLLMVAQCGIALMKGELY